MPPLGFPQRRFNGNGGLSPILPLARPPAPRYGRPGGFKSTQNQRPKALCEQTAQDRIQPGCAPGPGRPKGSRSRLQEYTLQLIDEDFRKHGKDILKRVRERWPQVYLNAIVSLLPKQSQVLESPLADLTDQEIATIEEMLAASKAKLVRAIEPEQHNGTAIELEPEANPSES